jgi:hypothetical protein
MHQVTCETCATIELLMPLRIAFDMEGVFAHMEGELVRQAESLFGEAIDASATRACRCCW